MCEAFQAIWELHTEDKIPLRTAAFVKALQVGGLGCSGAADGAGPCCGRLGEKLHCRQPPLAALVLPVAVAAAGGAAAAARSAAGGATHPAALHFCPAPQRVTRARVHRGFD